MKLELTYEQCGGSGAISHCQRCGLIIVLGVLALEVAVEIVVAFSRVEI